MGDATRFETILNNLLDELERLYFEHDALLSVLRKSHGEPLLLQNWQYAFDALKNDPLARAPSRLIFETVRNQLRHAASAEAALQVLAMIGDLIREKEQPS